MSNVSSDPLDSRAFRRVLGHYPSGVVAITSTDLEGQPVGMTVSSFTSVSLDPPLVAFYPSKDSSTWAAIRERGAFCVNVLAAEQEAACRQLAAKGKSKFHGVDWSINARDLPALADAVAWISCEIAAVHGAGDHDIVLGLVRHLQANEAVVPLLFFQGGYGRFTSSSIVTLTEDDIVEHLRLVENLRPDLLSASHELNVEVQVTGVVDDEMVMLATSGHPDPLRLPTRVGQRMPFVPPLGVAVAAFTDPRAWLDRGRLDDDTRRQLSDGIRRTQQRGWSATLSTIGSAELDRMLGAMPLNERTPEELESVRQVAEKLGMGHELGTIDTDRDYPLRSITVPVLDHNGRTKLVLTAYGLPPSSGHDDIYRYVDRLQDLARSVAVPQTVLGQ